MSEADEPVAEDLPDSITLVADRRRWLVVFLISVAFVTLAVVIGSLSRNPALVWIFGAWFLFRALVALPQVLGKGSRVHLDPDGFVYRTPLRTIQHTWRECSTFSPVRRWLTPPVSFSVQDADSSGSPPGAGRKRYLPDTFRRAAADFCNLMNAFRARALN